MPWHRGQPIPAIDFPTEGALCGIQHNIPGFTAPTASPPKPLSHPSCPTLSQCSHVAALSPRLVAICTDPKPACCTGSHETEGNNDQYSHRKELLIFKQILSNHVKGLSASDTWMQFIKNPNKRRWRNLDVFCNMRPRTNRKVTNEHHGIRGCAKAL